jgi:ribosome maturation factor RimP
VKLEQTMDYVRELVAPIVEELGYDFYHMEYVKENNENYLRIYIDRAEGISLEDCEKVSRPVSDMLDEKDPITDSYYLEVSSPGINRYLYTDLHLEKYKGNSVLLKLNSSFEGKKVFKGELVDYTADEITVKEDEKQFHIPRKKIKSVNLEGEL